MKKRQKIVAIIFFGLLMFTSHIAKTQSVEYFVKASLIGKIAQYTEWSSKPNEDVFKIAVLGKSPFSGELENLASGTKIRNKKIEIHYIKEYGEAESCNVLFICRSERKNLNRIVDYFERKNTMLIADTPQFGEEGVHFNFYTEPDSTIHFEINMAALINSGLRPDLQLLSIGKIIK